MALEASYRAGETADGEADLLLITDGELWEQEPVLERAKTSGHRIFTVGVGSAVSEGFVRRIAEITGGCCELVSPRESMAEHIVTHYKRIRTSGAQGFRGLGEGTDSSGA